MYAAGENTKNKTPQTLTRNEAFYHGAFVCGATGRIRTGDLLITNQLLYRLSHGSIKIDNKDIILQIKIKIHCFLFFLIKYFDKFKKKGVFK